MDLAQKLADILEEAAALDRSRKEFSTDRVRELVSDVKVCAADLLTWVSEREAIIRSNHKAPWFKQRFAEWERQGYARWNPRKPRERQFLLVVVPLAHDVDDVRADARRAAQDAVTERAS